MLRKICIVAGFVGGLVALSGVALGQGEETPASSPGSQKVADPSPVLLEQNPFEIEQMGIAIYIPSGAVTTSSQTGSKATASIFDGSSKVPAWQIIVSSRSTTRGDLTVEKLIDEVIYDSEGDLRRVKRRIHAVKSSVL
jgi:hypothetical protein